MYEILSSALCGDINLCPKSEAFCRVLSGGGWHDITGLKGITGRLTHFMPLKVTSYWYCL